MTHTYQSSGEYHIWVTAPQTGDETDLLLNVECPAAAPVAASPFDAQVRYILADMQIGGAGVVDYYRQHRSETAVAEALRSWDHGILVSNVDGFERKVVGDKGWQVVYDGTDYQIGGLSVLLTSDPVPASSPALQPRLMSESERWTRYGLVDAQLGRLVRYRGFSLETNADAYTLEVVRRWDAGVRVVNIDEFTFTQHTQLGGWAPGYIGTDKPISGREVILSTDVGLGPAGPLSPFESEVRYTLAIIQVGEQTEHYRTLTNEPEVAEAVRRWDAGIRLVSTDCVFYDPRSGRLYSENLFEHEISGADIMLTSDDPADWWVQ